MLGLFPPVIKFCFQQSDHQWSVETHYLFHLVLSRVSNVYSVTTCFWISLQYSYFFTFYIAFLGTLRTVDECFCMNEPFYADYKREGKVALVNEKG